MATAIRSSGQAQRPRPTRDEIDPAAVALLERHGAQLMATARRYAATPEDAEDAYQRGVEILLTKAATTDPAELLPWLKTVVKHEAFAVRKQAERHGTPSEPREIEPHAGRAPAPADLAERRDRLRLGTEALKQLKPQEMRALMLRAEGLSYEEICQATGWTYTKVNRPVLSMPVSGKAAWTAARAPCPPQEQRAAPHAGAASVLLLLESGGDPRCRQDARVSSNGRAR